MIFHPAIIALLMGSIVVSSMMLTCCMHGITILRRWDIQSGSELQLKLERRTYLISTMVSYAFAFQLLSLFLFIFTTDQISSVLIGAMCAAGSLNANSWGYPTVVFKIINFVLAGLWLILNNADNKGHDYPLIKAKYLLLLGITPFILSETVLQASYFLNLQPNVITSCCGTLFSSDAGGVTSGIIALPLRPVQWAFFGSMIFLFAAGGLVLMTRRGTVIFALASVAAFLVSIAALVSFISLYFYELPTHHCPFCILQGEYHYVGYPLYLALLAGIVSGIGVGVVGVLRGLRQASSLAMVLPGLQRRLVLLSMSSYLTFVGISVAGMLFSNLKM